MTVITRAVRTFFSKRDPSPMRAWARRNSHIWTHFDPQPSQFRFCRSCGEQKAIGTSRVNQVFAVDRHKIGDAWTSAGRLDKWCDGTETP